jgi:L-cysteate sulfo-lyase
VLGVHCGAVEQPVEVVCRLVDGLGPPRQAGQALRLRLDQVGSGYGDLTEPAMQAIRLAAQTEGIVLDPVYTGRAMAGLIAAVREADIRLGQRTVFLHSGGLPGFFGHPRAVQESRSGATPSNASS